MMSSLLRWLTRRVGLQKKQLTEQGDEEEDKYWTKLDKTNKVTPRTPP